MCQYQTSLISLCTVVWWNTVWFLLLMCWKEHVIPLEHLETSPTDICSLTNFSNMKQWRQPLEVFEFPTVFENDSIVCRFVFFILFLSSLAANRRQLEFNKTRMLPENFSTHLFNLSDVIFSRKQFRTELNSVWLITLFGFWKDPSFCHKIE